MQSSSSEDVIEANSNLLLHASRTGSDTNNESVGTISHDNNDSIDPSSVRDVFLTSTTGIQDAAEGGIGVEDEEEEVEEDLFGTVGGASSSSDINSNSTTPNQHHYPIAAAPAAAGGGLTSQIQQSQSQYKTHSQQSLLSSSGLLKDFGGGSVMTETTLTASVLLGTTQQRGGLFDEVDAAEAEAIAREEQEQRTAVATAEAEAKIRFEEMQQKEKEECDRIANLEQQRQEEERRKVQDQLHQQQQHQLLLQQQQQQHQQQMNHGSQNQIVSNQNMGAESVHSHGYGNGSAVNLANDGLQDLRLDDPPQPNQGIEPVYKSDYQSENDPLNQNRIVRNNLPIEDPYQNGNSMQQQQHQQQQKQMQQQQQMQMQQQHQQHQHQQHQHQMPHNNKQTMMQNQGPHQNQYEQNQQSYRQQSQNVQHQQTHSQMNDPNIQPGFGGASYYYSTSGNTQHVLNDPNNSHNNANNNVNNINNNNNGFNSAANTLPMPTHSFVQQPHSQMGGVSTHYNDHSTNGESTSIAGGLYNNNPGVNTVPTSFYGNTVQALRQNQKPNRTAGMHNFQSHAAPTLRSRTNAVIPGGMSQNGNIITPATMIYDPSTFKPFYGGINITDPILVQAPGLFSGPPHWSYSITVRSTKPVEGQEQFNAVVSCVRRRFRHFVALEDRLRTECPGAILPPRPNKHATRAIEEVTSRQSIQFALLRAAELEVYLNGLRTHPIAGKSNVLKLFLTLPDHIGTAWPEVSSSILTRITEVSSNTAVKVAEGTSSVISEMNAENQSGSGEDNANLLALAHFEGPRIISLLQSVPRINGAISIIKEQSERVGIIGLETQRMVKQVLFNEGRDLSGPFEILSSGWLRSGRRTKRLATELAAAAITFQHQYKLCKYERLAFIDRREALLKKRDARKEADSKSQKLVMHQNSLQSMGRIGMLEKMETDATIRDEFAVEATQKADYIGQILQHEVKRIADVREKEWSSSIKVITANMREACAERVSIWESCLEAFDKQFPVGVTAGQDQNATYVDARHINSSVHTNTTPQNQTRPTTIII